MNSLKKLNPEFSKILIIDKPKDITSFDLIRAVKKKFYDSGFTRKTMPKIGHTGTLDPFATGLVILLLGKATKLSDSIMKQKKTYRAQIKFGQKTNTADLTGEVIETKPLSPLQIKSQWNKIENFFCKEEYFQTPSMFSAIKINGKKLYELARQGLEISREKKLKKIYSLTFLEEKLCPTSGQTLFLNFETEVQSGTYIRTLAEDLAEQIHTTGHLVELRRIQSGDYHIDQSISYEDISSQIDSLIN